MECHVRDKLNPLLKSEYFDGLMQDCNISIANALEILQSCTKASIFGAGGGGE